jgi:ABC-type molybdate transport system permease subunit
MDTNVPAPLHRALLEYGSVCVATVLMPTVCGAINVAIFGYSAPPRAVGHTIVVVAIVFSGVSVILGCGLLAAGLYLWWRHNRANAARS